jgi:hypothetical protein
LKCSQQEIDESARQSYWFHAIRYGVQYYVSGRFAVAAHFTPVCATLLHHAAELLLKACLACNDSIETIGGYRRRDSYGHSLDSLWQEFRSRNAELNLTEYADVIARLDEFESIRYPDELVAKGAILQIGMHELDDPLDPLGATPMPEPTYVLMLPQIDRLVELLLRRSGVNLPALQSLFWTEHAATYLRLHNSTEFPGLTPGLNQANAR